jgi:opacity protein-like surface antigen
MRPAANRYLKVIHAALCLSLLATAVPASAEWYADVYGGSAYTPRSDVTLEVRPPGLDLDHTFHDVKWDPSGEIGARIGYWFDSAPWYGMGLDVFRFNANIPSQTVDATILGMTSPAALQEIDVSVTAFAFDLVRLRNGFLASPDYPKGRLQPYFTAGPALFRVQAKNVGNAELTTQSGTDTSTGYKVGGGVSWQLTKELAIFGEYRYTHVNTAPVLTGAITGISVPFQFNLNTQHVIAGLSFSF